MSEEAAFLAALRVNPADDTTRLVYADWLDEHHEHAKAEYLRLVALLAQCEENLASTPESQQLRKLAQALPEDWRSCTGSRFNVILDDFADIIKTIKWLREITGDGLGDCKAAIYSLPYVIHESVPFEFASAIHESAQPVSTARTRITRSESVPNTPDRSYTVAVICVANRPESGSQEELEAWRLVEREAREALVSLIVAVRGVIAEEAATLAVIGQEIVLASELTLQEARTLRFKLRPLIRTHYDGSNRGWWFWMRRYQPVTQDS